VGVRGGSTPAERRALSPGDVRAELVAEFGPFATKRADEERELEPNAKIAAIRFGVSPDT